MFKLWDFFDYRLQTFRFTFGKISEAQWSDTIKGSIKAFPVSDTIASYYRVRTDARTLSIAYLLENYALITDLLWYYSDTAYVNTLKDSLT